MSWHFYPWFRKHIAASVCLAISAGLLLKWVSICQMLWPCGDSVARSREPSRGEGWAGWGSVASWRLGERVNDEDLRAGVGGADLKRWRAKKHGGCYENKKTSSPPIKRQQWVVSHPQHSWTLRKDPPLRNGPSCLQACFSACCRGPLLLSSTSLPSSSGLCWLAGHLPGLSWLPRGGCSFIRDMWRSNPSMKNRPCF